MLLSDAHRGAEWRLVRVRAAREIDHLGLESVRAAREIDHLGLERVRAAREIRRRRLERVVRRPIDEPSQKVLGFERGRDVLIEKGRAFGC